MTLVATDWSIDRATGNIRYTGDDHVRFGGSTPSYATVIEFHRWLQDLADDASWTGGTGDELDITDDTPSERATDNLITLINGYNIDATAAEHLYDGSIVQAGGADIWDGIVNFGNTDVLIQIHQDGAVLADDWWNTATGGLNADATAGISHRFMLKTRTSGSDIDGRRILGTCRRFSKTYSEFKINGTSRGNNVLALSDATDLNNATAEGTVSGWTGITNLTEGYVLIDVNNTPPSEPYYSQWDRDVYSINQFYERMKWLTRDGSSSTLYGLNGELFRGITHEIPYTSLTGTFDEGNAISWSGTNSGTGQVLADNGTDKVWIQLLTGIAPANGDALSQSSPDAASATAGTPTEIPVSRPFCGVSTGSALIGAYGFALEYNDLSNSDLLTSLDGSTYQPPNNVTFTVNGLVADEDRVLVGPESGGLLNYAQLSLQTALTGASEGSVQVSASIPSDTPSSGTIRVETNSGLYRLLNYTSFSGDTFTLDTTYNFSGDNASATNDVFISYIDELADSTPIAAGSFVTDVEYIIVTTGTTDFTLIGAADSNPGTIFTATGAGTGTGTAKPRFTTASFTIVYASPRSLFIRVRDGGTDGDVEGIKTFETTGSIGSGGGSTTVIRTPDA